MTTEQTQKLKETLKKVPIDLLKNEVRRRRDEERLKNCRMCQPCRDYGKRTPGCQACYEMHKTYCRNSARIKRGIPLDAPLQTRSKK